MRGAWCWRTLWVKISLNTISSRSSLFFYAEEAQKSGHVTRPLVLNGSESSSSSGLPRGKQSAVLADVVGKDIIEHYQLKIFAVLFSSFEDIVWMDASGSHGWCLLA
jgi:hypothetical protein